MANNDKKRYYQYNKIVSFFGYYATVCIPFLFLKSYNRCDVLITYLQGKSDFAGKSTCGKRIA